MIPLVNYFIFVSLGKPYYQLVIMLILPLLINNRRINYLSLKKSNDARRKDTYVVELPKSDGIPFVLFSLNKGHYVRTLNRGGKDLAIKDLYISADADETGLKIKLEEGQKEVNQIVDEDSTSAVKTVTFFEWGGVDFEVVDSPRSFRIEGRRRAGIAELNGELKCDFSCLGFSNHVVFHLAEVKNYVHFGLDFGSEASQMAITSYKSDLGVFVGKTDRINLFSSLKAHLGGDGQSLDYLQYEKDKDFVKSNFFLKKQFGGFDTDSEFFLPDDTVMRFLVKDQELNGSFINSYHQLVNLKLAHRDGDYLNFMSFGLEGNTGRVRERTLKDLKGQIYSSILRKFVAAAFEDQLEFRKNNYIRFSVLVPNIYGLREVLNTQEVVYKIIEEFKEQFDIKGCEVDTLSESDSAFLGFYGQNLSGIEKDKYYITIDCGKGTTDFSILQTDGSNEKDLRSVYRNGFAGAGNLISYAFFEAIVASVIKNSDDPEKTKDFFNKRIEDAEKSSLNAIFRTIENLKFNYDTKDYPTDLEVDKHWQSIENGDLNFRNFLNSSSPVSVLASLLSEVKYVTDSQNYIMDSCDLIAANLVKSIGYALQSKDLKNKACGGILLTGRGFLFEPLKEKLVSALQEKLKLKPQQVFVPATSSAYKSICMNGVFQHGYVTNPEMVGQPISISLEQRKSLLNFGNFQQNLGDKIERFFGSFDERNNYFPITDLSNKKFLIGNTLHIVPEANLFGKGDADLVFSKDGYFVRQFNSERTLELHTTLRENFEIDDDASQSVVPSLFPNKIDKRYIKALKVDYKPAQPDYDDLMV